MAAARVERRLAAILAADVAGYSRLMERDETGTLARLKAHRQELVEPLIAEHHGRIVKLMGDGALCEFASVVDAVACAAAVQRGMAERERDVTEADRIRFRVGVNLGDVIVEGGDIYGDGVNIAARLEQSAEPGGVLVSGTAFDQVEGKLGLAFEPLGERRVKNIARPVRAYRMVLGASAAAPDGRPRRRRSTAIAVAAALVALLVAASAAYFGQLRQGERPDDAAGASPPAPAEAGPPSVVVLPFLNLGGDAEQEFFVDGLTEDLITDLSSLAGLFVISRNSSFAYKHQTARPREVARDLGVTHVLNGSIRRAGDQLRVTAQLIDAASDRQVWAGRYDRELTDVFAVQDELARAILAALAVELSPREQARVSSERAGSVEAYEYYLRGRRALNLLTRRALRLAYHSFEQAIALDPGFAEAYAALAMTYAVDLTGANYAWNDWVRPPGRAMVQVPLLAQEAASLQPGLAAPELALARLRLAEWRYDEAVGHARAALEREPGNADAHATHALVLTAAGRHEEALRAIEESLRRDPKPPGPTLATLGVIRFALRDYGRAVNDLDRSYTAMVDGGSWFYVPFRLAAGAYGGHPPWTQAPDSGETGHPSIAAVEFNSFYRQPADMRHLLGGLRMAGVSQLPPELRSLTTEADPVAGPALDELLVDRTLETLCWNPTLKGEMRFSTGRTVSWTVRHDVSDTGSSRVGDGDVCVTLPTLTRNREACFAVFEVASEEPAVSGYGHALAGPSLCFFRPKE